MTWAALTGAVDLREAPSMVSLARAATLVQQRGRAVS
jgi:hypothetical protein